jgi:hypothetical protein
MVHWSTHGWGRWGVVHVRRRVREQHSEMDEEWPIGKAKNESRYIWMVVKTITDGERSRGFEPGRRDYADIDGAEVVHEGAKGVARVFTGWVRARMASE